MKTCHVSMHVAAKLVELNCLCVTVLCVMRYAYFALCTLLLGTRNNLNSKKRVPGLFDRVSPTPGGELVRAQRGAALPWAVDGRQAIKPHLRSGLLAPGRRRGAENMRPAGSTWPNLDEFPLNAGSCPRSRRHQLGSARRSDTILHAHRCAPILHRQCQRDPRLALQQTTLPCYCVRSRHARLSTAPWAASTSAGRRTRCAARRR